MRGRGGSVLKRVLLMHAVYGCGCVWGKEGVDISAWGTYEEVKDDGAFYTPPIFARWPR
jgi:hypothetical protein